MKPLQRLCLCLLLPTAFVHAEASRQECVGRLTFAVPEDMQWAVAPASAEGSIGGQSFSENVRTYGASGSYGYDKDSVLIHVTGKVSRREFENRFTYDKDIPSLAEINIRKDIETHKRIIKNLQKDVSV